MSVKDYIWYEKYRPKTLEEMSLPKAHFQSFSKYLKDGEVPHLLFYGPAGSGKTTIAFILMESIGCTKMVLNASSGDRGIATMRGKVKTFAGSETLNKKIKVVFLDEADGITPDAQLALKNTFETYSSSCRFILTCNDIGRIDPAIQSRCMAYEFSAFPEGKVLSYIETILGKEKIKFSKSNLEKIIEQYYPDVRSIVNTVQLCSVDGKLDPEIVNQTTADPNKILDLIMDGQVAKLRIALVGVIDFTFLYKFLYDVFLQADNVTNEEKMKIVQTLSEHLFRDASVANKEINFIDCAINLMVILECKEISFLS